MEQGVLVPFVGGSYEYRSRGVSVQQSLNLYTENIEDGSGKVRQVLVSIPGETVKANVGSDASAPCRGLWYSSTGPGDQSYLYACYGNKMYRIDSAMAVKLFGAVASGTGPVSITDNGFKLVVADGVSLWEADLMASDVALAGTWIQVSLPNVPGTADAIHPSQVWFLNQRLIINTQRNIFFYSDLASTTFQDLSFYSAEQSADAIRAMAVVNNRLWIFGDRSYEVWAGSGGSNDDPLSFLSGSASQIGIQAVRSVATIMDVVFWLGASDAGRNTVWMAGGLNAPSRVSTNALEAELAKMGGSVSSGGVGWCYYDSGHTFYVLSFASANRTFVYDLSTEQWHERSTHDWDTGDELCWEPMIAVTAYNDVYFGGATSNRLMVLSGQKYTDWDGKPIVCRRTSPIYWSDCNIVTLREFLLDMEVGTTGLLTGQGSDPKAMLEISRDGGSTWDAYDWRSFGKQGQYGTFVKWTNLGSGRSLSARVTFSEPVPVVLYQARLAVQESSRR